MHPNPRQLGERRSFFRRCGILLPGSLFSISQISPEQSEPPNASPDAKLLEGEIVETVYEQSGAASYLVELEDAAMVLGLGPQGLFGLTFWETPNLIQGNLPSILFHSQLDSANRQKLLEVLHLMS